MSAGGISRCPQRAESDRAMKYTIYTDKVGEWRWRLQAANNEIIASGEGYINKSDCFQAIKLVKGSQNAPVTQSSS